MLLSSKAFSDIRFYEVFPLNNSFHLERRLLDVGEEAAMRITDTPPDRHFTGDARPERG
jgi:hypothetical protein